MFHIIGLMLFSTLLALAIAGLIDAFAPIHRRLKNIGYFPAPSSSGTRGNAITRLPRNLISASR